MKHVRKSELLYSAYGSRLFFIFAVIIGLFHVAMSIVYQSTTYDEYYHYNWSLQLIESGRLLQRVDGYVSTTPINSLNVLTSKLIHKLSFEDLFSGMPGVNVEWWPRRATGLAWYLLVVFATLGLAKQICHKELSYISAGLLALAPTIIAHASTVTVDVPYAAASTSLLYALVRNYKKETIFNTALVGFALGLCFIAKFSAVLCIPIVISYLLLSICAPGIPWSRRVKNVCLWVSAVCVCIFTIDSAYGFSGLKYYTADYVLRSQGLKIVFNFLPNLFFPLPQSFVAGVDECLLRDTQKSLNIILHDTWSTKGRPEYFIYNYIYKTPFTVLIATVMGLLVFLGKRKSLHKYSLLFHFALGLFFFSFLFSHHIGFRYVLHLLPILCILSCLGLQNLVRGRLLMVLPLALAIEVLLSYPKFTGYFLTYYNPVLVPEKKAFNYVIDSNLDWNQTATLFWENRVDSAPVDHDVLQPGRNIFSANRLAGVWWDFPKHAWLRRTLIPVDIQALNYYVYDLNDVDFKRYLHAQRRLHASEIALERCLATDEVKVTLAPGETKRITSTSLCLDVKEGAYIKIKKIGMERSTYQVGEVLLSGYCDFDTFRSSSEAAWYEVEKGNHVLCLSSGEYELRAFRMDEPLS